MGIHPTSRSRSLSARVVGAAVAAAIGLGVAAVLLHESFGGGRALERPELVVAALVVLVGLGWGAGGAASRGGWRRAAGVGVLVGLAVVPAFTLVAVLTSVVDAVIRGAAGPLDGLAAGLVWGLFGLAFVGVILAAITVPLGFLWGLVTLALVKVGSLDRGGRRAWGPVLVGLVAVSLIGGVVEATRVQPAAAVCRSVGEGAVVDAAFSPAGDLLAVATRADPNQPGVIVLLNWPSGDEVARWRGWLDEEVAVSPAGDVYWSGWILGLNTIDDASISEGVYVAREGVEPEWFATGFETPLNDLTWTTQGLRGTTPNSHRVESLEAGATAARATGRPVGAFWSSADAQWTATGPAWDGTPVTVVGPGASLEVPVPGDPRSLALTANGSTLVVATWFDGTRAFDLATGSSRLVIAGSQRFIALSPLGDLAWANEEVIGHSQLCTAALADL